MANSFTRIKTLRVASGQKQIEMAAYLEVTPRHYQDIEYGNIDLPSSKVIKLCQFFSVSADYLLGLSDKPEVNK